MSVYLLFASVSGMVLLWCCVFGSDSWFAVLWLWERAFDVVFKVGTCCL